jgi:GTPase SAR1 family protein
MFTLPNRSIKILIIGYSDAGKTYFLGSLNSLSFKRVSAQYSIMDRDFIDDLFIEETYEIISGLKEGVVYTSSAHRDIDIIFKQGANNLFDIKITDVEGQGVEPKKKPASGSVIAKKIPDYDGVIVLSRVPVDANDFQKKQAELNHLITILNSLLTKETPVPIALGFTQIDAHPLLHGLAGADGIKKEVEQYRKELEKKGQLHDLDSKLKDHQIERVNYYISDMLQQSRIHLLVEHFRDGIAQSLESDNKKLFKPFPCSVFGFDNCIDNPKDIIKPSELRRPTKIAKRGLEPYGTRAAFLWLVYKIVQLRRGDGTLFSRFLPDTFEEAIVGTISDLFNNGEAYHDANSHQEDIWSKFNF